MFMGNIWLQTVNCFTWTEAIQCRSITRHLLRTIQAYNNAKKDTFSFGNEQTWTMAMKNIDYYVVVEDALALCKVESDHHDQAEPGLAFHMEHDYANSWNELQLYPLH
eukprot:202169_1